jgi:hypothetical protein
MSRSTELDPCVVVSDDPSRVDVDVVWRFLSTAAYWGRRRARADVDGQIRGAWRVVGVYASDGAMVGFAAPNASYLERPASPERARLVGDPG